MLRLRVISCIDVQRIPSPADQQQPQAQAQQIGQLFGANGLNGGRNAPMRVAVAGYQSIPLKRFVPLLLYYFFVIIIMTTLI